MHEIITDICDIPTVPANDSDTNTNPPAKLDQNTTDKDATNNNLAATKPPESKATMDVLTTGQTQAKEEARAARSETHTYMMYTCIYICVYVCVHICIHIRAQRHVCALCIHVYVCVCAYT